MSTSTTTRPARPSADEPAGRGRGRNRRLIAVVVAAVTVVVAAVAVWLVAFSSVFGVKTVAVHGSRLVGAADVRGAADIGTGTPLVRLDTAAIARRVRRLPEIASARVETSYPSTVTITVTDRTPVGYVRSDGLVRLVDRTGKQYRVVAHAPHALPRLVIPDGTASAATARAAASVAASLPTALLVQTSSVQALSPLSITVVLDHGRVVQWGSATRNAAKARVLPVLLRRQDTQIDVTDPDQPFTR